MPNVVTDARPLEVEEVRALQRDVALLTRQYEKRRRLFWLVGAPVYTVALLLYANWTLRPKPESVTPIVAAIAPMPPSLNQVIADWAFPRAESTGTGQTGNMASASSKTNRPFKEIWEYYARKCGYTMPAPGNGMTVGSGGSTLGGGVYDIETDWDADHALAHMLFQDHDQIVTVLLNQDKHEKLTRIFVSVMRKDTTAFGSITYPSR